MPDRDENRESPLNTEDQEIGAKIAEDGEALLSVLPHYYRGEISQANNSQDRIDQTTNWAITLMAALLSLVFANPDMPAYLLLVGILSLCIFLWFEARRYRFYDIYRSRVRFFQENVFANALEPIGAEHSRWREELSEDLREATFKITFWEALSRRIRRIYGLLFAVLGIAWGAKITLFTPEGHWTEAAELPGIHGRTVLFLVGLFFLCVFILSRWPPRRRAKGEVYGEEPGVWKDG